MTAAPTGKDLIVHLNNEHLGKPGRLRYRASESDSMARMHARDHLNARALGKILSGHDHTFENVPHHFWDVGILKTR